MTMQELIPLLIEDGRYFTERETQVPKLVPARTHKNWRIQKKWRKRFGEKVVYEIVQALDYLKKAHIGGLIIFERDHILNEYINIEFFSCYK